jgi:hypothetical protein
MGRQRYPKARELTITADGGGSNGTRVRLWKVESQKLADQTGLVLHVHHYPPGTSKWNKIEHRLFWHITQTDDGIIKDISDGIVFPILSALSRFVKRKGPIPKGTPLWRIVYPKVFHDEDMLIAARRQLTQCGGRPMLMGRSGGAYEALMTLAEMAERYSDQAAS